MGFASACTVSPDIYVSLIKERTANSGSAGALELDKHVRLSGLRPGLHLLNRVLVSAHKLFEGMLQRDFTSSSVLIDGYMEMGEYEEAYNAVCEDGLLYRCERRLSVEIVTGSIGPDRTGNRSPLASWRASLSDLG